MAEPKRAKSENVSSLLFPHRLISAETVTENIKFSELKQTEVGRCISFPVQSESHVLVQGKGKVKLYLEAVEKGDDRLELLFNGSIISGTYLLVMYSPSLRISPTASIQYSPYNHRDIPCTLEHFNLVAEESKGDTVEEFSNSCTLSKPVFSAKDKCMDLLKVLEKAEYQMMGPPDYCRLGTLSGNELYNFFSEIDADGLIFYNPRFISYLESITGLELKRPARQPRILTLEASNYMMLNEERGDREVEGLDFYWVISQNGEKNNSHGSIQYINKESGEVVATLKPIPNTMHLAYRSEGALRFIRYIPKTAESVLPIYYITITYQIG